jgi:hypothetical protein
MAADLAALVGAVGTSPDKGADFYKFIFEKVPDLKKFFKCEDMKPADVPGSARFKVQGEKTLKAVKEAADKFSDDGAFKAFMADLMSRHQTQKADGLTCAHFAAFFDLFGDWSGASAPQKAGLKALSDKFTGEAKALGFP